MLSRRLIAAVAVLCLFAFPASAQKSKSQITSEIGTLFPDNTAGAITAQSLRNVTTDIVNSYMQGAAVKAQTGTSYTVQCADMGALLTFNNAASVAVSLPAATTTCFSSNWAAIFKNTGTGPVVITPGSGLINGFASLMLPSGQGAYVFSDGTNYQVFANSTIQTITPISFGAACDGITDDTSAITSMISAVSAGSTVQFPSSSCKITGTINFNKPLSIKIPNGGGLTSTGAGAAIQISSSNFSIACEIGAVINGPRTPSTGNDYLSGNTGIYVSGTNGTHYSNISVTGCGITNFKEAGIWAAFCDQCTFNNNNIQSISYAGILCYVCTATYADRNYISTISSSNGPAYNINAPTNTKTNAYGITFTTDGAGHFSQNDWAVENYITNIPTWECLDTHAGIGIHFINNKCVSTRVGVQVTTDGGSNASSDVEVMGNYIYCISLNQPVYPGGASSSVGGAGILVAGVSAGSQATDVNIVDNTIIQCGSSETGTPAQASIEVGDAFMVRVDRNNITAGRWQGIYLYGQVIGQITGNNFNGIVAGPIGSTPTLIYVAATQCQCLLARNFGNSSGSYGYTVVAQSGGYQVGIARDNSFFNLTATYNPGGPATNRIDLGATAP